jgi:glycosyltransferase involved in cell wall biosynthesis
MNFHTETLKILDAHGPLDRPAALLIEGCNFVDFPSGGCLSSAISMIRAFGTSLALVGYTTGTDPVGRWYRWSFEGSDLWRYNFARVNPLQAKPLIPRRISVACALFRHRAGVLELGCDAAFMRSPELYLATSQWGWQHLAYEFPGVSNPLLHARYKWGRLFAGAYERVLFERLSSASVIFAAADAVAIEGLIGRSGGRLANVIRRPTTFDQRVFYPAEAKETQAQRSTYVSVGRLNWVKGWDLVLAAFAQVARKVRDAELVFVGDGEDRPALETAIDKAHLRDRVWITGNLDPRGVANELRRSRVFVLGSWTEGWSTATVEAIACGLSVVTTNVSGSNFLVHCGVNGYIVPGRSPEGFAKAMLSSLELPVPNRTSIETSARYGMERYVRDIGEWFPVLGGGRP